MSVFVTRKCRHNKHRRRRLCTFVRRLSNIDEDDLDDQFEQISIDDTTSNDELLLQFHDQITGGSLPCPKDEAALLASVQLCVEENWPNNKRTQTIRRHLLNGQFSQTFNL
jgi:hypothetical protein